MGWAQRRAAPRRAALLVCATPAASGTPHLGRTGERRRSSPDAPPHPDRAGHVPRLPAG